MHPPGFFTRIFAKSRDTALKSYTSREVLRQKMAQDDKRSESRSFVKSARFHYTKVAAPPALSVL